MFMLLSRATPPMIREAMLLVVKLVAPSGFGELVFAWESFPDG